MRIHMRLVRGMSGTYLDLDVRWYLLPGAAESFAVGVATANIGQWCQTSIDALVQGLPV